MSTQYPNNAHNGPLSGVRIIDLSNVVSGPMAVQILADQGADVIKIEHADGDSARNMGAKRHGMAAMFAVLNRNKRSLVIDMHQEDGKKILFALAKTADVLVQNFRPGAMARMGIDYPVLKALNPSLIYTSISGFGGSGPYANRRVYDPVIQAITGFVATQVGKHSPKPQLIKNIVCDKATALTAAQAITAALFARTRSGKGQALEVTMMDASLAFLWPDGMWNHTLLGDDIQAMPSLADIYRIVETRDGAIVYLTVSDTEWQGLCRALGRAELGTDPRYADITNRIRHLDELIALLTAEFAQWATDELCQKLDDEDVPFAKINSLDAVHCDPQIVARESIAELQHPHAGKMRAPHPAARFADTPASLRFHAPTLGEHSDEILTELGYSDADVQRLRTSGAVR